MPKKQQQTGTFTKKTGFKKQAEGVYRTFFLKF